VNERKGIRQVSSNKKRQGDPRMGEGGDPRMHKSMLPNLNVKFLKLREMFPSPHDILPSIKKDSV
jgi:hypothetical protein